MHRLQKLCADFLLCLLKPCFSILFLHNLFEVLMDCTLWHLFASLQQILNAKFSLCCGGLQFWRLLCPIKFFLLNERVCSCKSAFCYKDLCHETCDRQETLSLLWLINGGLSILIHKRLSQVSNRCISKLASMLYTSSTLPQHHS